MPSLPSVAPESVSSRFQFITHMGKKVLFVNCAHCDPATLKAIAEESRPLITREPPNSVLTLMDVTGAGFDPDSVSVLKARVKENAPYVKRSAVIGVSGLQLLIYEAVKLFTKRNIPLFATREEALAWLVKD